MTKSCVWRRKKWPYYEWKPAKMIHDFQNHIRQADTYTLLDPEQKDKEYQRDRMRQDHLSQHKNFVTPDMDPDGPQKIALESHSKVHLTEEMILNWYGYLFPDRPKEYRKSPMQSSEPAFHALALPANRIAGEMSQIFADLQEYREEDEAENFGDYGSMDLAMQMGLRIQTILPFEAGNDLIAMGFLDNMIIWSNPLVHASLSARLMTDPKDYYDQITRHHKGLEVTDHYVWLHNKMKDAIHLFQATHGLTIQEKF